MATTRSQAKIGVAVGLAAQQDRPCGLAGVFDELARGVDGARDGALKVVVVAAVELVLVAARSRRSACVAWVFGRGLHAPRPG